MLAGDEPEEEAELELEQTGPPLEHEREGEAGEVSPPGGELGPQCRPQQIVSLQDEKSEIFFLESSN